jgi:predicted transcriptional regulator
MGLNQWSKFWLLSLIIFQSMPALAGREDGDSGSVHPDPLASQAKTETSFRAAEGAGSVPAEWGTTLKKLVDLAPESASSILKSAPAEKWSEALPTLSQKSVAGLASLQKVAPDVAETVLKQGADEALSFGQTLTELAESAGKAPAKVIKEVVDSAASGLVKLEQASVKTPHGLRDFSKNPLKEVRYTDKVQGQMKQDI